MKNLILFIAALGMIFTSCKKEIIDPEQIKMEVWKTVKSHNKAWAVDENIAQQMKYVHTDIVSVSSPFVDKIIGVEKYKENYQS